MKKKFQEIDGVLYNLDGDAVFTKKNKKDYTLLVPSMCDVHFKLLQGLLTSFNYNVELLNKTDSKEVSDVGLKYVHNDTCYPATLVIGELIQAVQSGKYDTHKLALVISQTGGGCRASNYLFLLKKALKKAGFGYIPVLSFNFNGLDTQPGFKFSLTQFYSMLKCVLYGDLITSLKNQCEPYEKNSGETVKLVEYWVQVLCNEFNEKGKMTFAHMKKNFNNIISSFEKLELINKNKVKVGIVGEIFIKYSALGNNELEKFLVNNDAEVVVPGLTDFLLYCIYNNVLDFKLYGMKFVKAKLSKLFYKFILSKQKTIQQYMAKSKFTPISTFDETLKSKDGVISEGVKMGEGWLLTAEIVELIKSGTNNVIIAQPFGCLPNHIVGKGMMKKIKELLPDANIIAIDYDASQSRVNQENRIRLMLSNAKLD